jgi:hypothetical protein
VAAPVQALQTIVSRNVRPLSPAVVSVTKIHAGSEWGEGALHVVRPMFSSDAAVLYGSTASVMVAS